MVSLAFVFWLFVTLGCIVGMTRGWAKELLVIFSVVLGLFVILVLETYVGFIQGLMQAGGPRMQFWVRSIIIFVLAFFGYQTPGAVARFQTAARREKLQDSLLGIVLGGLNGYLIVGSVWAFLDRAGYPFELIRAPQAGDPLGEAALRLIAYLPPNWLDAPEIYFAVAVAFTFVVIVFV
ncbi:MAG: CvpA family protein [Chloroflexi bacterium]|nr:CvpA family protein [Chloroflexota bacterium]